MFLFPSLLAANLKCNMLLTSFFFFFLPLSFFFIKAKKILYIVPNNKVYNRNYQVVEHTALNLIHSFIPT